QRHHAAVAHGEPAGSVGLGVDAHGGAGRDDHALVDDRPADDRALAHLHVVEQDRVLHGGSARHAHAWREHRAVDGGAAQDHAVAQHGVGHVPGPVLAHGHDLGRRHGPHHGVDGPLVVVEVELGQRRHEIHVGLVVGVERSHVAPVVLGRVLARHAVGGEVVHVRLTLGHERGHDVAADVVTAALLGVVAVPGPVDDPGGDDGV